MFLVVWGMYAFRLHRVESPIFLGRLLWPQPYARCFLWIHSKQHYKVAVITIPLLRMKKLRHKPVFKHLSKATWLMNWGLNQSNMVKSLWLFINPYSKPLCFITFIRIMTLMWDHFCPYHYSMSLLSEIRKKKLLPKKKYCV